MGLDPYTLYVPIVGGASGESLVPIFSKALPTVMLTESATNSVVQELRKPVMEAACNPLIPLLGAHAIKRLILALCSGLANKNNVLINAFVASDLLPCCRYLASPVLLGTDGVKRALNIPKLSDWELNELSKALWRVNALTSAGEKHARKLVGEQERISNESKTEVDPNVLRAALRRKGLMRN
ncbi:malate dehydrogenase, mitochondrial-like [Ctenocephalides felis]|uniref:malate dehydrogenase, mitochondrial-like n=1 Tax=Ctenocephalides felis TaxID=7515 RepID=UPI000E6E5557|nr:malate dehydrogenase, mitochondrial-like [Ctenocephalides felis]